MNKIFDDYVACLRKRMLVDNVGGVDAPSVLAKEAWDLITTTRTRNRLDENPALREAIRLNGLDNVIKRDKDLREYLEDVNLR